ncbi:effector binding domain-containing protein [Vagococcus sp. BWB3-3]|uniref:Effector binding domain-containing protein n=1 Tax=Vagococcus allomyrinae TaxID=2794353 RepID=A0A940PBC4_9ENTE|nr:effector binding domain-containing protein [Vagococcus allomyrinae]MBP1040893.1 effector binding domain-containing protein [Vagococcus allomyrinae]
MSRTNKPEIKTFQIHQEKFTFLGNETILTNSVDFELVWNNFFRKGGYHPILQHATDSKPINIWYTNNKGQEIYSQGLFVNNVEIVPEGYTMTEFPGSDFFVVTTEWMATNEEAVGENGNGQCNRYADKVQIPEGYIRNNGPENPITAIEKENCDTPEGSRYEVWVPIKKA